MLSPIDFLLEECENIERSLKETLRHSYGRERSKDFYKECNFRLGITKTLIENSNQSDLAELEQFSTDLSELSALIARIERSHIGEFSWSFSDELEKLAQATCSGLPPQDDSYAPIFAISSEGGLDAYSIHREQNSIPTNVKQKIFNIIFPRTLKHHVLLHPILGHEICHAALMEPSMCKKLSNNVLSKLEVGPLKDVDSMRAWLSKLPHKSNESSDYDDDEVDDIRDSWAEEILCDLFGLIIFGPCFIPAHFSLLSALEPKGTDIGDEHPPNKTRFDILVKAAVCLGWNVTPEFSNEDIAHAFDEFWKDSISASDTKEAWAIIYSDEQICEVVKNLAAILEPLNPAKYNPPKSTQLEKLVRSLSNAVPPIGSHIDSKGNPNLEIIDFRSILYAGWITWYGRSKLFGRESQFNFLKLNRLCDKAILQQQAVNIWLEKAS